MSFNIVVNQSDIVQNGLNSTLVYNFPNSVTFKNHQIALINANLYYAWQNINDTTLQNNKFSYTWTNGTTTTTYPVVIPPGIYEITDINYFLEFTMIENRTFLIDDQGLNVYYIQFQINPTAYAIELTTYAVPTSLPTNWTTPSSFAGFPTTTFNPIVTIPPKFNDIVGFPANFQTSENLGIGTELNYLSTKAPQVQPNSSLYLSISNIDNRFGIPSSIIYTIVPQVNFNALISEVPPQFSWCKLIAGTYNELRIQLLGLNYSPIDMLDPNMSFMFAIKNLDEDLAGFKTAMQGGKS